MGVLTGTKNWLLVHMIPVEIAFYAIAAAIVFYFAFKRKQRMPLSLSKSIYSKLYAEISWLKQNLSAFNHVYVTDIMTHHFLEKIEEDGRIEYLPLSLQNKLKSFYANLAEYDKMRSERYKALYDKV